MQQRTQRDSDRAAPSVFRRARVTSTNHANRDRLFWSATHAMVLLDHAGRILDFNEAFTKFSKNADQYQGLKVWDVLPLADPCALHEALDTSRYLNEPNTIDVGVRHPYGERFVPLQATITPLRADDTRWQ